MTKMTSEGHILGCLFQKQCSHCRRHAACLEFSFPSRHSGICWVISHYLQRSRRDLWMKNNANHLPRSTSPPDIILPPEWLSLQVLPQRRGSLDRSSPSKYGVFKTLSGHLDLVFPFQALRYLLASGNILPGLPGLPVISWCCITLPGIARGLLVSGGASPACWGQTASPSGDGDVSR